MKSCMMVICLICAMLFPSLGHSSQPGDMYLRFLEGDVQVKTEDAGEWLPASINMPLIDGDQIWVPDNAKAELILRGGTIIRLDRNSYLEILASEEKLTRFYLVNGRVYSTTRLGKADTVVIETPTAFFRAYGQSIFGIDVSENEDSTISVFQGELYGDQGAGEMKINVGTKMIFSQYTEYPRLARIDPLDQWEQWNRRRDQEFGLSSSGRAAAYLPDELGAYSSDFERNGKWAYDREYGYVWTPTVIIAKSWSPYRIGRWVWMRGDYVWISHEPWGWAPYHYGRWAFINHRGWCWIPPARGDVYWGPGFVGWVYTPTYISWVPLAPREIYYGRGNYGPHSVNIININIDNAPVNNVVYRNIRVNNAVTTLHRDAFVTGRPMNTAVKENLFMKERRVMGAPDIRPERSTRMPVIKNIARANRPPQQIVNRVSDERGKNNRFGQIQPPRNLPSGPIGSTTRTGQINDRKIETPQSLQNVPARTEQTPAVRNPNIITGPQETREERPARRSDELRHNAPPQNNIQGAGPQQSTPLRSTVVPERKIKVQGRPSQIPTNDQPARTNTIQQQTTKPSENVRLLPPLRSNSPAIPSQMQPQNKVMNLPQSMKTDEKLTVRDIRPQETREIKVPNNPSQNIIKEAAPQQAAPVRAAIVPERRIETPERKIEVLNRNPEASTREQKARAEVGQQQNLTPIENTKIAPPVRPNGQAAVSQPQPPLENTEKTEATPKTEQFTRQKVSNENIRPEDKIKDFKKEAKIEMQQRKR